MEGEIGFERRTYLGSYFQNTQDENLTTFERGLIVDSTETGTNITKTSFLLKVSHPALSRVFRQCRPSSSSDKRFCDRKRLVNENNK